MENNAWISQLMGAQQQIPQNNFYSRNYMAPHYEIVQVTGRAGAENFKMGPNSNFLLLDNTAPIIWFVKTDGAGLLSATPFDYTLHQDAPPVDLQSLQERVNALEAKLNDKSNFGSNKQHKNNNKSAEGTNQVSN